MPRDSLFQSGPDDVDAFRFDDRVARVFNDMIVRSVPGYAATLAGIAGLARALVPEHGHCYDLGCSLGAATLAVCQGLGERPATITAVDTAEAMLARGRADARFSEVAQSITFVQNDIATMTYASCDLAILGYTLQFIPPSEREHVLTRISSALRPGGALILAEKFRFEDPDTQALMTALHEDHKRANGYSELEIAGKRAALDNVLIADTRAEHVARLERAGFTGITLWQAQLNFGAFVAFRRD